jgi:cytochrome bd-type quinol oxidase subunit 2
MVGFLQLVILNVVSYAAFGGGVWAIVDIARRRPEAFVSAGKQTKVLWLIIVVVATAVLFLALPYPFAKGKMSIFDIVPIAAAVGVIIYHVGVKPALGTHRRGPKGGGRSNKGSW